MTPAEPAKAYYKHKCAYCATPLLWEDDAGHRYSEFSYVICSSCSRSTPAKGAQEISDLLAAVLLAQGASTSGA